MRHRYLASMAVLAVVITVVSLASAPVAGQAQSSAATTWTPPRTPDGQPDLQGMWNFFTLTPFERPKEFAGKAVLTREEAAAFLERTLQRQNRDAREQAPGTVTDVGRAYNELWFDRKPKLVPDRRTSLVVDPPDGRIPPYTSEARQRFAAYAKTIGRTGLAAKPEGIFVEGVEDGTQGGADGRGTRADNPEDRGVAERCFVGFNSGPPMMPLGYNANVQFVQTRGFVVILNEMIHDARIVPLDGRPHLPPNVRQWMGDSRGRWEGNTLVVETSNFTDKTKFMGSSDQLHLVERFTRVDAETISYEITLTDPTTWTRPWTAVIPMTKTEEQIYEYACQEGNYGLDGQLRSGRAEDKVAAAKKGTK